MPKRSPKAPPRFHSRTQIAVFMRNDDGELVRVGTMVREVSFNTTLMATMLGFQNIHDHMLTKFTKEREAEFISSINEDAEEDEMNLVFKVLP